MPGKPNYKSKKKTYSKKPVSKEFMKQYNKMIPSKETRKVMQIPLNTSPYLIPAANVAVQLSLIDKGTDVDERVRNSVYISYVQIKGTFAQQSVTNQTNRLVRLMIVKEVNFGSLNVATMANLFMNNNFGNTAPDGLANTGRWTINRDLYHVLYDKRFTLAPALEGGSARQIKESVKIGQLFFYPQTGASNNPCGGRLMAICSLCEPNDALNQYPVQVELQYRVFFKDHNKIAR